MVNYAIVKSGRGALTIDFSRKSHPVDQLFEYTQKGWDNGSIFV